MGILSQQLAHGMYSVTLIFTHPFSPQSTAKEVFICNQIVNKVMINKAILQKLNFFFLLYSTNEKILKGLLTVINPLVSEPLVLVLDTRAEDDMVQNDKDFNASFFIL
jgi:hypothetical protein